MVPAFRLAAQHDAELLSLLSTRQGRNRARASGGARDDDGRGQEVFDRPTAAALLE